MQRTRSVVRVVANPVCMTALPLPLNRADDGAARRDAPGIGPAVPPTGLCTPHAAPLKDWSPRDHQRPRAVHPSAVTR